MVETKKDKKFYKDVEPLIEQLGKIIRENEFTLPSCVYCIVAKTMRALEAGATKEEILETISVNVAMSGTTGIAESLRVLKLLDELGK